VTDPIRVGMLGTGRIGRLHAELIARRVAGLELAGVYDADADVAGPVADRLGATLFRSATDLLESPHVDAVAVCTSTDTHAALVVAAAEAGKPVFCEKPISLSLAEVDRALAAVEHAEVLLQVGFNRRFDPGHHSVRDAVASGAIGEAQLVRISSRDPAPPPLDYVRVSGGIFLDMTIHDFDMARFVTGSEVEQVFARGEVRVDPAIGEAGDFDTIAATLRHADGTLTLIDNSRRAVYGFDQRVEAFGADGMATSANQPRHGGSLLTAEGVRSSRLSDVFSERYEASYVGEWEAFAAALARDDPSPVTGADGRAALAIGLAAARSAREGRAVNVAEIG
jgi:myo-inositol 2-dehydrogenase / D-chiro-inositol 1-dehydrogenase